MSWNNPELLLPQQEKPEQQDRGCSSRTGKTFQQAQTQTGKMKTVCRSLRTLSGIVVFKFLSFPPARWTCESQSLTINTKQFLTSSVPTYTRALNIRLVSAKLNAYINILKNTHTHTHTKQTYTLLKAALCTMFSTWPHKSAWRSDTTVYRRRLREKCFQSLCPTVGTLRKRTERNSMPVFEGERRTSFNVQLLWNRDHLELHRCWRPGPGAKLMPREDEAARISQSTHFWNW